MSAAFTFLDLAFEPVCRIEPDRDLSGAVRNFRPHLRLESDRGIKLLPGGEGPFCKFSISKRWRGRSGVYVFLVDGELVYVGECDCLVKRMNQGYGSISPRNCFAGGQPTNVRINSLIRSAVLKGQTVELAFYSTDSRKKIEAEMIKKLKPPWNRALIQNVPYHAPTRSIESPVHMNRLEWEPTLSCRDKILNVARDIVREKGRNEFTVAEIINRLGTNAKYSEGTIRTHVTSRCCKNAPKNHAATYEDFERIGRGLYRLIDFEGWSAATTMPV